MCSSQHVSTAIHHSDDCSNLEPEGPASPGKPAYTVPVIYHTSTDKYIMGSAAIAQFLESVYPDKPVLLRSPLGQEIELKSRTAVGPAYRTSLTPRELTVLSPPAQEYFRRTREASLGHPLEELLHGDKEEETWAAAASELDAIGRMMLTNKAEGPFLLGAKPSYTDFFIAGSLQCARVIDEGVFQRTIKYPGFGEIYEACLPYIEQKKD